MKTLMAIMVLGVSLFSSCKKEENITPLSEQEKSDLLFLREEEKLARDVYTFSFNKYGSSVFSNISNSEQSHMNSVLTLLNKYGLTDPVSNNSLGVFKNGDLQTLYNQLVVSSDSSLSQAFQVGALIEDLDLRDIKTLRNNTTKADLLNVYDKLSCGSRNHMRGFVSQLGSYTPKYISQAEYNSIINSTHEQCGK